MHYVQLARSVIAAGMLVTAADGYELKATPSPMGVVLRRESEEKEPGEHFAVLDQANCYAEVADGSLADVWAAKPGRERMTAAQACSVESCAVAFLLDSGVDWVAV